jgi:hypothetical protein
MTPFDAALNHPVVTATLTDAGWSPDRSFATDDVTAKLGAEGFHVIPLALEVLASLGGLTVKPPVRATASFGSGAIVFDPLWAASGEADRIHQRERELGVRLCPVAEWSGEYILLVAEDGQVFAETTFQLLRLGRDINEAILRLIVADTPPEDLTQ